MDIEFMIEKLPVLVQLGVGLVLHLKLAQHPLEISLLVLELLFAYLMRRLVEVLPFQVLIKGLKHQQLAQTDLAAPAAWRFILGILKHRLPR